MPVLQGVVGALLTPFDEEGAVHPGQLQAQYDFLSSHCDAVSVLGAEVSEYRCLPPTIRRSVLTEAVSALSGRVQVLAGVSAGTLSEVSELSALAAEAGADFAQMLLPTRPSGGQPTRTELVRLVEQAVDTSPLPLVLYHHPGQGADPAIDTLVALCAIEGVVGIKDSSRDISRNLRLLEEIQHAGHARYLATIQPMLPLLLSGGAGAMMPPPLTLIGAGIRDAVAENDLHRAGQLQRLVTLFPARWSVHGLLPLAKKAMQLSGMSLGDPLGPFEAVPDREAREIEVALQGWEELLEKHRSRWES